MRKNVSPIQLAANRRNAQKSTGPKTSNGKAVSKMNALKHGALAKSLIVHGYKIKESSSEFRKLCQEFYNNLSPLGPLEESLVDQIIQATWRLRRVRKAEAGEIALNVDTGWWARDKHDSLRKILDFPETIFSEPLYAQLQRSAFGCHFLVYCFQELRKSVEEQGELTETALNCLKNSFRNKAYPSVPKLEKLCSWFQDNPEKLEPEVLRARHKEDVLRLVDREIRDNEYWMERCERREAQEEQSRQSAALLPSAETSEKILRYETALERQLFRAMHELERLQRRRQGETVSAPVAVNVSRL